MQITRFEISTDRTQIALDITDAANVSTLRFWDDNTYKDYSKAIDLSSKLTASSVENIIITLSDLGIPYFDGVYFLDAEDPSEISTAVTKDLTRYKECILNKVVEHSVCDDCLQEESISLINAKGLITSLEDAIDEGFINEIILIIRALDKYCSNDCITCGQYDNIKDSNYYSSND